jgi:hypothetical protein
VNVQCTNPSMRLCWCYLSVLCLSACCALLSDGITCCREVVAAQWFEHHSCLSVHLIVMRKETWMSTSVGSGRALLADYQLRILFSANLSASLLLVVSTKFDN